jgi:ketosteroid isomerase-like protein
MSEENVEIVRRIYADYVDRPEAVRELFGSDFEFDGSDTAPDIGVVRGFDAFGDALRTYIESFEQFRVEVEDVIHSDERLVIVAVIDEGRMRGSDAEVRNHRFHVWTLRDAKVVRFSTHLDRAQAFEAAGLQE